MIMKTKRLRTGLKIVACVSVVTIAGAFFAVLLGMNPSSISPSMLSIGASLAGVIWAWKAGVLKK